MIWIWLLLRNNSRFATGPLTRYLEFICAHCGFHRHTAVITSGYGTGSNSQIAYRMAWANAEANVRRAMGAAVCPQCGRLPPHTLDGYERAARTAEWRAQLRVPVSAGVAVLVLLLVGVFALQDRAHSTALFSVSLFAALAAGAASVAVLSRRVQVPYDNPAGVWFSSAQDPDPNPNGWVAARSGDTPKVGQPNPWTLRFALAFACLGLVFAFLWLHTWSRTFRSIYVVSAEQDRGGLTVQIDGERQVAIPRTTDARSDAPFGKYQVRTDRTHKVVITDSENRQLAYELDPKTTDDGWVIAPHAAERNLCLTRLTTVYGSSTRNLPEDVVLNLDTSRDWIQLTEDYDDWFAESPATEKSGTKRTALRALDCAALDRDQITPYKSAPPY